MRFDLLYELQAPKPHDARSEYRCYHEALAQIELVDRLGFHTVSLLRSIELFATEVMPRCH